MLGRQKGRRFKLSGYRNHFFFFRKAYRLWTSVWAMF